MDKISIKIKEDLNISIKEYLKTCHIGRSKIEEIRVERLAYLNGNNVNLETVLSKNDLLEFEINETVDFVSEHEDIDVVYEDEYLLVVNKPSGIIIHGDSKDTNGTLANRVAFYYRKNNIHRNVRYLHRIDRDTSGLVMFAKDFITEGKMIKKIEENDIERYYLGIACGKFEKKSGEIVSSIGTDRHVNGKMCISNSDKAKYAKTTYNVLKECGNLSLVEYKLFTGRTHQIRVHTASIRHPLYGDKMYGWLPNPNPKLGNKFDHKIDRVCLHSYETRFKHPINNKEIVIKQIAPLIFNQILSAPFLR